MVVWFVLFMVLFTLRSYFKVWAVAGKNEGNRVRVGIVYCCTFLSFIYLVHSGVRLVFQKTTLNQNVDAFQ